MMDMNIDNSQKKEIYNFREAHLNDVERVMLIIAQAKTQMKRLGSKQWQEDYPAISDIEKDIARNTAFVLCIESTVIAYGSISVNGEPAYTQPSVHWQTEGDYIVVHRLAVADEMKHKGVASHFFHEAARYALSKGISLFRVDTNFDNHYMLQLLDRADFKYCGDVVYDRGRGSRKAFEKLLK
jgi:GNAT superfamily N-acetyltransferase